MKKNTITYILTNLILCFYKLKVHATDYWKDQSLNSLNLANNLQSLNNKVEIKKVMYLEDFCNIKNEDLKPDELNIIEVLDFSLPKYDSCLDDYEVYLKEIKNQNSFIDTDQNLILPNLKEINLNNNLSSILRKKWLENSLVKTEILKLKNCDISLCDLEFINEKCENLKTLDLSGNNYSKFSNLKNIKNLKKVENLILTDQRINNDFLEIIGLNMKLKRFELKIDIKVNFDNLDFKKSQNSLEVLKIGLYDLSKTTNDFIKKFQNLRILITQNGYFNNSYDKTHFLFDSLQNLEIIDISERRLAEESFLSIIKLNKIKELYMNNISFLFENTKTSSFKCSNLKKLHLSKCNLDNNILKKFLLDNIDSLEYLDISHASNVNNFFKVYFEDNNTVSNSEKDEVEQNHKKSTSVLNNLNVLYTDLDNKQIERIIQKFPLLCFKFGSYYTNKSFNLNIFNFNSCKNFVISTQNCLKKKKIDNDSLRDKFNLTELSLESTNIYNYELIQNIIMLKYLKSLSIKYVTFKGKIPLYNNSNNSVKKLVLDGREVTYDIIIFFNKCFPQLKTLNLKYSSIKLFGIRSNSEDIFQSLVYLNLIDCEGYLNDFFVFILHCPNLMLFLIKKENLGDELKKYLEDNNWFVLIKNQRSSFVTLTRFNGLKNKNRNYNLENDLLLLESDEDPFEENI